MTHDRTRIYNASPLLPVAKQSRSRRSSKNKVEYVRNMGVIFHEKTDQRITLIDVAYVPGLGSNLYSLHATQRTHLIVSDASGTHIIGANLSSSAAVADRICVLPGSLPWTIGARKRNREMHATNLLRHCDTPFHLRLCATSPGTIRKHHGPLRSGLRQ